MISRIESVNDPTFNFNTSDVKSYGKQKFFQYGQNEFLSGSEYSCFNMKSRTFHF